MMPLDYYKEMARRDRLLIIETSGRIEAICTFFVLRGWWELPLFHPRDMWTTPDDSVDGSLILVDQLGGERFNRRILRRIEFHIASMIPSYQEAVWFRPKLNTVTRVTYHRREHVSVV